MNHKHIFFLLMNYLPQKCKTCIKYPIEHSNAAHFIMENLLPYIFSDLVLENLVVKFSFHIHSIRAY